MTLNLDQNELLLIFGAVVGLSFNLAGFYLAWRDWRLSVRALIDYIDRVRAFRRVVFMFLATFAQVWVFAGALYCATLPLGEYQAAVKNAFFLGVQIALALKAVADMLFIRWILSIPHSFSDRRRAPRC